MGNINIYCDESRHTNNEYSYTVIGAVTCPKEEKRRIINDIDKLKFTYKVGGEFGWKSVSDSRLGFYKEIVSLFFLEDCLSFRCVVANKNNLWTWGINDELGFYTVYYQLLCHWLRPGNDLWIYLDRKKNTDSKKIPALREKLKNHCMDECTIHCLEEVDSTKVGLVQIADMLIGAVGYSWNNLPEKNGFSKSKSDLCALISEMAKHGKDLKFSTWPSEQKFNVFLFGGE